MKTFSPKSKTDTQQARNHPISRETESASGFIDNGPEAIAQRKLQAMMNQSPQVQRLAQLQAKMNNSPRVQAQTKLQAMLDNSPRQVVQRQQFQRMFGPAVQLQEGVKEEKLQMQAEPGTRQRQSLDEDEELVQGKFVASETPMHPETQENRTGLPDHLKTGLETLSGMAMDDVNVHYHSNQPAQLNALAYTQGTDIHVGPGQEKHLPHEAWHVVQQRQGRVKPTLQAKGVAINDDAGLEREADVMGAKAVVYKQPAVQGSNLGLNLGPNQAPNSLGPSATGLPQQHRNVTQTVAQLLAMQLPSPVPANPDQWQVDTNGASRVHLRGWIDEAAAYFNFAALSTLWNQLNGIPVPVRTPFETHHWLYTLIKTAHAHANIGALPGHLNAAYDNLKLGAVVLSFQQQVATMKTHLPFPVGDGIITNYLNQPEKYTVATIANAKLQGAIGHHIFIEFADGTISEYAWPQTKATYPKSQKDRRTTTRAQIARLKMSARHHGFAGRAGRYYMDSPIATPRFQGYVYFPWYQDCFHWIDAVLSDADEPPAHLVRMTKGAVFKWGGVAVLLAGTAYLALKIFGGNKSE